MHYSINRQICFSGGNLIVDTELLYLLVNQLQCCTWDFGISSTPRSHDQAVGEGKLPSKLQYTNHCACMIRTSIHSTHLAKL